MNWKEYLEQNLPVLLMRRDGEYEEWDDVPVAEQASYVDEAGEFIGVMARKVTN